MKEYKPFKDEKEFLDSYFFHNSELDNSPCKNSPCGKEVENARS